MHHLKISPTPALSKQQERLAWGLLVFGATLSLVTVLLALHSHLRRMKMAKMGTTSRTVMSQLVLVMFGMDVVYSACMLAGAFVYQQQRQCEVTAMVTVAVMTCLIVWNLLIAVHSLLLLRPAHDTWKTLLSVRRVNACLAVLVGAVILHVLLLHTHGLLGHCMMICWLHHPPEQMWFFYVPMGVAWVIITAIVLRLVHALTLRSPHHAGAAHAVRPLQRQVVAYSLSFIIVFIIPVANRSMRLSGRSPPVALFVLLTFSLSLRGFFDALVFGWLRSSASGRRRRALQNLRRRAPDYTSPLDHHPCSPNLDVLGLIPSGSGSRSSGRYSKAGVSDVRLVERLHHHPQATAPPSSSSASSSSPSSTSLAPSVSRLPRFLGLRLLTLSCHSDDVGGVVDRLAAVHDPINASSSPIGDEGAAGKAEATAVGPHTIVVGCHGVPMPSEERERAWWAVGGPEHYVMWHAEAAGRSVTAFVRASDVASGEVAKVKHGGGSSAATLTLMYRDTTVSFMTAPDGAAGLGEALHAEAVRLGAGGEAVERYLTLHHTLALLPPPHRVSTSLHHHHGGQHPVHDGKAQSSSKWWPRWLETLPSHHSPTHPHGLVGGDEAELRVQGGGAGQALVVVHSLPERVGQLRGEQQQGGSTGSTGPCCFLTPTSSSMTLLLRPIRVYHPLGLDCSLHVTDVRVRWLRRHEEAMQGRDGLAGMEPGAGDSAETSRRYCCSSRREERVEEEEEGAVSRMSMLFPLPCEDDTWCSRVADKEEEAGGGSDNGRQSPASNGTGLDPWALPAGGRWAKGWVGGELGLVSRCYPGIGLHMLLKVSSEGGGEGRSGQGVLSLAGMQDSEAGGWVDMQGLPLRSRGRVVGHADLSVWLHIEVPAHASHALLYRKKSVGARWWEDRATGHGEDEGGAMWSSAADSISSGGAFSMVASLVELGLWGRLTGARVRSWVSSSRWSESSRGHDSKSRAAAGWGGAWGGDDDASQNTGGVEEEEEEE